jgi:hypothetical protein
VGNPQRVLDKGADVEGLHVGEPGECSRRAPSREAARPVPIRFARVVNDDLGGAEFPGRTWPPWASASSR